MQKLLTWLFVGILAIVVVPRMWHEFQDRHHSGTWPTVEGNLTDAYIKEVVNNTSGQSSHSPHQHSFVLVVEYSYRVHGREYVGHRVRAAGMSYGTEKRAKEALDNFKSQKTITVYYDPKDPASSVLIPG